MTPKFKRNLNRIIPFGVIWLVIGWVFLLSETLVTGNQNPSPQTSITLTTPVFIFASLAVALAGILFGTIELVLLEKKFKNFSFGRKVFYKFIIYFIFIAVLIGLLFPIATSIEHGISIIDDRVWKKSIQFYQSLTLLNTLIQLSFHILISLLYAAISENIGYNVLSNFFTGKYHKPKVEQRIFMFLDMKDSTTIAEKLGHKKYFDFLQAYYETMSDPIINCQGEVYQYIGDEVVITWLADKGIVDNNCLQCFEQIKKNMKGQQQMFIDKFGISPDFKASLHIGEVTTGEIGALKKEIVYTGDVLNTAARIQALCNEHQTDLIISQDILNLIKLEETFSFEYLGEMPLKGKSEKVRIHKLIANVT